MSIYYNVSDFMSCYHLFKIGLGGVKTYTCVLEHVWLHQCMSTLATLYQGRIIHYYKATCSIYVPACVLLQGVGRMIRLQACTRSMHKFCNDEKPFSIVQCVYRCSRVHPDQLCFSCFWLADILSHANACSVCTWTLWIWREY